VLPQRGGGAASDSCNRTLAERIIGGLGLDGSLPEIFQPRASCADAAVKLLGLPYEFWSLALYLLIGVLAWRLFALQPR
jgi:protein dithiol:quinone oxidoreductase